MFQGMEHYRGIYPVQELWPEGLLQSVRDKERKRRSELARREANKRSRVDKDW
ncbi:MAG: hypothetical protein IIC27_02885 [Chloroflexi bacterium]|nr:hypothetical protein [Chloroflexota bacterium]